MNNIKLSDHFTYKRLLRFVLPSVIMMVFTSVYGIVDGVFVSNFVGKTPFAAVNLIMPVLMILGAVGFMIGTGGTAIVSQTLGEGKRELADRYFSLLVYVTAILGVMLSALGIAMMPLMAKWLGAEGELLENCVVYGRWVLVGLPFFMLQNVFQSFAVTAERPKFGLAVTVAAGVTNMVLDALLVAVFPMGIAGAAIATAISQFVGGVVPLVFFFRKNNGTVLTLGKTQWYGKVFLKTCTNGSSELMSNISMSVVTILYNFQLMKLAGENGIAAYGTIMYIGFIFAAIYIGYAIGCAPLIGFNYGAGNKSELKNLLRMSIFALSVTGVAMTIASFALARPLSSIFVGYDAELCDMTVVGMRFYSFSFLLCGFNIFGSAFFTALGNGLVSALISFLRTLVFQCLSVAILPVFFGLNGVWSAIIVAELASLALTIVFMLANAGRYGYGNTTEKEATSPGNALAGDNAGIGTEETENDEEE